MINKINKVLPFSELMGSQVFKRRMGKGSFRNGISDILSVDHRDDLTEDEKIPMRITAVGDMVAGGVMSTANPFGLIIGGGIILTNLGIRHAVENGLHKKIKGTWKNARANAQQNNPEPVRQLGNPCLPSSALAIVKA